VHFVTFKRLSEASAHREAAREMAREMGGESVVSEILSGKRKMNLSHIAALSRRFHVSPAVFFSS
jgi:HTH-type transcriptional regulator/antitoxin HigA